MLEGAHLHGPRGQLGDTGIVTATPTVGPSDGVTERIEPPM